ncbi:MAG TPA: hypothetical protein VND89_10460 [Acidimicrobiales bacterium]|nr:hypothetical protein [Acidimicrobiales bacterium]
MLALFVGDDEEPNLIDRPALQIAFDQEWAIVNDSNVPVLSFRVNADVDLEPLMPAFARPDWADCIQFLILAPEFRAIYDR